MAEGETTKYLETAATLWPLVDEAGERSTELESPAEAEKWFALLEGAEKIMSMEMSQAARRTGGSSGGRSSFYREREEVLHMNL
ncbi:hypothetical protein Acr_05g0009870 [Actinidia rufa]|uniref:Uncharacterized protein n=1 Tax=Actinidia rufa TaxID=165716 RepID=A0A7J0ELL6_9ERIC|nr:hypothetical protein Acr_05g0009870 [Actinidia rufa]